MFEIGNSLREARLRQSLDLARVEDDTKIRAKYLQALEDERFEILPSETYVKGFMRTYAEYLGLDGQVYVDEYNSRFAHAEEPIAASVPRHRKVRRAESNLVVVALAGIVAVAVLVVVAFAFSNGDAKPTTPNGIAPTTGEAPTSSDVTLVLRASKGDCWAAVHENSTSAGVVFSGTIYQAETQTFGPARRLYVEFRNRCAKDLTVGLNGMQVTDFPVGKGVVVVTTQGVRTQD
jgi:cytoskeleton protein RodZ